MCVQCRENSTVAFFNIVASIEHLFAAGTQYPVQTNRSSHTLVCLTKAVNEFILILRWDNALCKRQPSEPKDSLRSEGDARSNAKKRLAKSSVH